MGETQRKRREWTSDEPVNVLSVDNLSRLHLKKKITKSYKI